MRFSSASILSLASVIVYPAFLSAKKQTEDRAANVRGKNMSIGSNKANASPERALKSKKGDNACLPDYSLTNIFPPSGSRKSSDYECDLRCDTSCLYNTYDATDTDVFLNAQQACRDSEEESLEVGRASCIGADACTYAKLDVEVGDRSCIGSLSCFLLEEDVKVGENACIENFSCLKLPKKATIGDGSCVGGCGASNEKDDIWIGVLSCIGDFDVCKNMNGTVEVGYHSCIDRSACFELGSYGHSTKVGDRSCSGESACKNSTGNVEILDSSCHGKFSCLEIGKDGFSVELGSGSCYGYIACSYFGNTHGASVGDSSCIGNRACLANDGYASIGDGSCHGEYACVFLGRNSKENPVTIADNACRGSNSCSEASFAAIGKGSCIGSQACQRFNYESGSLKAIGENSCIGIGSCFRLQGANIGCGSCIGRTACTYDVDVLINVGDNACIGESACCDPKLPGETPGVVPDGECNRVTGAWISECNTCA